MNTKNVEFFIPSVNDAPETEMQNDKLYYFSHLYGIKW